MSEFKLVAGRAWPAVVALVALRFAIGWHFYVDGAKKLRDPDFRSEYFLDSAVGPFRGVYHGMIPDPFGVERLDLDARRSYAQEMVTGLKSKLGEEHEAIDPLQRLLADYLNWLDYFQSEYGAELLQHRREVQRYEQAIENPNVAEVPSGATWLVGKRGELRAAARPWIRDLDTMQQAFRDEVAAATGIEPTKLPRPVDPGAKSWVDHSVSWTVFLVGVALMLGFLVRPAAMIGALFLVTVMLTQPFWVADANVSYLSYQLVEIAGLLVLAAMGAGRFAGLDFFLERVGRRPRGSSL